MVEINTLIEMKTTLDELVDSWNRNEGRICELKHAIGSFTNKRRNEGQKKMGKNIPEP